MKYEDQKSGMEVVVWYDGNWHLEISPMKAITIEEAKALRPILDAAISHAETERVRRMNERLRAAGRPGSKTRRTR